MAFSNKRNDNEQVELSRIYKKTKIWFLLIMLSSFLSLTGIILAIVGFVAEPVLIYVGIILWILFSVLCSGFGYKLYHLIPEFFSKTLYDELDSVQRTNNMQETSGIFTFLWTIICGPIWLIVAPYKVYVKFVDNNNNIYIEKPMPKMKEILGK